MVRTLCPVSSRRCLFEWGPSPLKAISSSAAAFDDSFFITLLLSQQKISRTVSRPGGKSTTPPRTNANCCCPTSLDGDTITTLGQGRKNTDELRLDVDVDARARPAIIMCEQRIQDRGCCELIGPWLGGSQDGRDSPPLTFLFFFYFVRVFCCFLPFHCSLFYRLVRSRFWALRF